MHAGMRHPAHSGTGARRETAATVAVACLCFSPHCSCFILLHHHSHAHSQVAQLHGDGGSGGALGWLRQTLSAQLSSVGRGRWIRCWTQWSGLLTAQCVCTWLRLLCRLSDRIRVCSFLLPSSFVVAAAAPVRVPAVCCLLCWLPNGRGLAAGTPGPRAAALSLSANWQPHSSIRSSAAAQTTIMSRFMLATWRAMWTVGFNSSNRSGEGSRQTDSRTTRMRRRGGR